MDDLALDSNLDLDIKDGDFTFAENYEKQAVETALYTSPGEWMFYPPLGIGIKSLILGDLSSSDIIDLKRRIRLNLKLLKQKATVSVVKKGEVAECRINTE